MHSRLFLQLLLELSSKNRADLVLEEAIITVRAEPFRWILTTKVFSSSAISSDIYDCFRSQKKAFFHNMDSHLIRQDGAIYLIQIVPPFTRYTPFRDLIQSHLTEVLEWQETFLVIA